MQTCRKSAYIIWLYQYMYASLKNVSKGWSDNPPQPALQMTSCCLLQEVPPLQWASAISGFTPQTYSSSMSRHIFYFYVCVLSLSISLDIYRSWLNSVNWSPFCKAWTQLQAKSFFLSGRPTAKSYMLILCVCVRERERDNQLSYWQ